MARRAFNALALLLAWLALVACLVGLGYVGRVRAAPPAGVDLNGPIARWVQGWQDANGFGCCGLTTDCRPTLVMVRASSPSGYMVWVSKELFGPSAPDDWVDAPVSAFSEGSERNPSGVSWACWASSRVLCASLGSGM